MARTDVGVHVDEIVHDTDTPRAGHQQKASTEVLQVEGRRSRHRGTRTSGRSLTLCTV